MNTQSLTYARPSLATDSRPWMPMQLFAASLVFGPLAAGLVAGLNFSRIGHKSSARTVIVLSAFCFVAELVIVALMLPENVARPAATLFNLAFGGLLVLIQKPAIDQWKAAHWRPKHAKDQYRPNELGKLFLAALVGLAIEVALIGTLLFATGQL